MGRVFNEYEIVVTDKDSNPLDRFTRKATSLRAALSPTLRHLSRVAAVTGSTPTALAITLRREDV